MFSMIRRRPVCKCLAPSYTSTGFFVAVIHWIEPTVFWRSVNISDTLGKPQHTLSGLAMVATTTVVPFNAMLQTTGCMKGIFSKELPKGAVVLVILVYFSIDFECVPC